jgi:hypothetical protein
MDISAIKYVISLIAIALTVLAYIPYIRDTYTGKTKPHTFSWLIWTIGTGIIFAIQSGNGAGPGGWVTGCLTALLATVLILSLRQNITKPTVLDYVCLVAALGALGVWYVIEMPLVSMIILSIVDMVGFIPTIRKSWSDPHSETISLYFITTVRHILAAIALTEYNAVTLLFPISWILANAAFTVLLFLRRKNVPQTTQL